MTQHEEAPALAKTEPRVSARRRDLLRLSTTALVPWAVSRALAGCANEPNSTADSVTRDAAPATPAPPSAAGPSSEPAAQPVDQQAMEPERQQPAQPERQQPAQTATESSKPVVTCATPTTFEPIVDDSARASFIHTADSTSLDWLTIGLAQSARLSTLPERLLRLLKGLADLSLGYPLDMLQHSLQVATRAQRDGASDELVLCALCHRIGMAFTIEGYAELSAALLRGYVSDDAYRIVLHNPEYAHTSAANGVERRMRYASQSWHPAAVRFCDAWQNVSYDPSYDTLPLSTFEPLLSSAFGGTLHDPYQTRNDCV